MNSFTWRVAVAGYKWRAGNGGFRWQGEWFPAADLVPDGGWKTREYQPLNEFTGLFRTFADTPPTKAGILGFADSYGHLGDSQDLLRRLRGGGVKDPDRRDEELCDSLMEWKFAIGAVRECVEEWDAVRQRAGDDRRLEELRKRVDQELGSRVSIRLLRDRRGGVSFVHEPVSLLGAIWLQLAQAMVGVKQYRACASCGRWFEVSPNTMRADAVYCKEACRSRAYRARKERAVELAAEGKTPRQIAKELGSDIATVKGWLARGRGK